LPSIEGQDADRVLSATVGRFKTPTLRDLGQSAPYMHSGRKREIEEAVEFYVGMSAKARQGRVRNAARELSAVFLTEDDVAPLAAFLRALNEDYN
jgi:cytochrome c peroxidase